MLATYSKETLPMLITPIPNSSNETPKVFLTIDGNIISSASPSTKITPLENNNTERFASKYFSKRFESLILFNFNSFSPNSSNPLHGCITTECNPSIFMTLTFLISAISESWAECVVITTCVYSVEICNLSNNVF